MLLIATKLTLKLLLTPIHDDADWINQGDYKNSITDEHCCGPRDCTRVPDDLIAIVGDNAWMYLPTREIFIRGKPGVHKSIDGNYWRCKHGNSWQGNVLAPERTRCFFYPEPNS